MLTEKTPKNAEKYICEDCDFKCSKQSDYNRHLSTAKHKILTNANWENAKKRQKTPKNIYVKIVTLNAANKVITIDIYPLQNTKS